MKIHFFSIYNVFLKNQMTKFLTFSADKRSFENAFLQNLGTNDLLLPQTLEHFITSFLKSPTDLDHLSKSIKKLPITPHSLIKTLFLVHTYLQSGKQIIEDNLIAFMNYLLFQCTNFIESNLAKSVDSSLSVNGIKNRIIYTDTSTRQDESCDSKETLIFNMGKIYIRYVLRIVAIYDDYKILSKMKDLQSYFVWMMINLLKNISNFTSSFITIGRYFIKEYGQLAISMIEIFNKDIKKINESIRRYIIHKNHILSCETNLNSSEEISQFIKMMEEINSLNETLIQIYLGKYFYNELQHLEQPSWINTNSNQFDTIFKIAGRREKQIKVKQKFIVNKVCRKRLYHQI